MANETNEAFMRFTRRAEVVDRAQLTETFVDAGPLMTVLTSRDHQVVYGRRGTGKTHALSYLVEHQAADGDLSIYIDLRNVGSTGGIYSDPTIPLAERGTRLLLDVLGAIHDSMLDGVLDRGDTWNLAELGPRLDRFADALTEVAVVGTVERETAREAAAERVDGSGVEIAVTPAGLSAGLTAREERRTTARGRTRTAETGIARHRVHFGRVSATLQDLAAALECRTWIVLDEWSNIPLELQPYLADLLRRTILPITGYTVKLGAIEQRSNFRLPAGGNDYIGLELGADIAADMNLDDFMVFENDPERAKVFFSELLFRHYQAVLEGDARSARNAEELVRAAFTQVTAFDEFIRAAEGVPRDAINIIGVAAQRALNDAISVTHIRAAAKTWYQRDKEAAVRANPAAHELLHWVIDEVIGERRARAFLLQSDDAHPLIDALFDARVLHVLKKSISARDTPGVRYDVYKLDYGCYVDLISTARAPGGLLPLNDDDGRPTETFVEVPPDDYRSSRRAILSISRFEQALAEEA